MRRLAIDPGDIHVGWAFKSDDSDEPAECGEWKPKEACREVKTLVRRGALDEIVLEEFRLYDKNYEDQSYSPFQTVQLIGAIKWIAIDYGPPIGTTCPQHGYSDGIHVHEQGAYIKTATRRQLVARKIRQVGVGTHARDAELHLWNRVLRQREGEA